MKKCGRSTEVYSRVTGYFRPLKNWNAGKQEEFRNRWHFAGPTDDAPRNEESEATVEAEACVCS